MGSNISAQDCQNGFHGKVLNHFDFPLSSALCLYFIPSPLLVRVIQRVLQQNTRSPIYADHKERQTV